MLSDELKEEYFHLQKVIEDFDSKSITIKAWSVTLSMSGIGAAFIKDKCIILLLSGISALLFWIVEASWKHFQFSYYSRIREIEKFARGELSQISPLQINTSWKQSYHERGLFRFLSIFLQAHVLLPHGIIFIVGITLYLLR